MDLTCGARVSVAGKREGGLAEDATQNRKCIPRSAPRLLGPTGLGEGVAACGGKGGLTQWTGPDLRDDSNKSLIFEF
jgi:hypothetical protein